MKKLNVSLPYIGCNLRCSYCRKVFGIPGKFDLTAWEELVSELKSRKMIDEDTIILFASGELTIYPQCSQILSVFKDYSSYVFSNCIAYNKAFADHIALGKTTINSSIDSGTKETFEKVKGVDKYENVFQNLKMYSEKGAKIHLKYILLRDVNDNEKDANGFVQFAKDLRVESVAISKDNNDDLPMNDNMMKTIKRISNICTESDITVIFDKSKFMTSEFDYIEV